MDKQRALGYFLSVALVMAFACSGDDSGTENATATSAGSSTTAMALTCEEQTQLAADFLLEHAACVSAVDCQGVDKGCYEGPEVSCGAVSVAAETDVTEWQAILEGLEQACPQSCGGNACGASIDCVEGRCSAVFP